MKSLAVFTQPDRPAGRDLKLRAPPVKVAARELDLHVFQPEKIRALRCLAELVTLKPEVIVVAAYGQILPKAVLSLPPFGCINIHASLSAAPPGRFADSCRNPGRRQSKQVSRSCRWTKASIPATSSSKLPLPSDRARQPGACTTALLSWHRMPCWHALTFLGRGAVSREKQDGAIATYAPKLTRKDGEIDWSKPAEEIERRVRAMTPWPGAHTFVTLQDTQAILKIHRAEIFEARRRTGWNRCGGK